MFRALGFIIASSGLGRKGEAEKTRNAIIAYLICDNILPKPKKK
jgi:hypothetical protein